MWQRRDRLKNNEEEKRGKKGKINLKKKRMTERKKGFALTE